LLDWPAREQQAWIGEILVGRGAVKRTRALHEWI